MTSPIPHSINSEIGSEQELEALSAKLQEHRMGLLLDIVPNHMAAGERESLVDGCAGGWLPALPTHRSLISTGTLRA